MAGIHKLLPSFVIPSGSHYAHTALSFALYWNKTKE